MSTQQLTLQIDKLIRVVGRIVADREAMLPLGTISKPFSRGLPACKNPQSFEARDGQSISSVGSSPITSWAWGIGMAKAIGLRVYLLSIAERGNPKLSVPFDSPRLTSFFPTFLSDFVDQNVEANNIDEAERTWLFERSKNSKELDIFGQISYGTFGFESKLKNNKSKVIKYERQINDVEEIPLYFQFWSPGGKSMSFAVFQSFQGKSCIQLVIDKLKIEFENIHLELIIKIRKLVPSDLAGGIYNSSPVKSLRLIKKNASTDIADLHLGRAAPETVDIELTLKAHRSQSIGKFGAVARSLRSDGVIVYNGMEFSEAVAMVRFGGKLRPVGMFGSHTNAGVIDISDSVIFEGGHPTPESVRKEAKLLLADFYAVIAGR